MTKITNIKKISIELNGNILICETILNAPDEKSPQFAFYVFRNEKRIHTAWYTKSSAFEFDTNGTPGYYRVETFVKYGDGTVEITKSAPIFANPVEISTDSLPAVSIQEVTYLLKGKTWDFPALYYPNESKALFVMMPSAINRQKMILPVFSRWTWALKGIFPGSVLCIADPTLDLDDQLQLGWLLGNKEHCATAELAEFVVKFAQLQGIPNDKIIIYGSSAGGFAALALAAHIEGSVAVAINSQTDALSYESSRQVALVRKSCFDDLPEDVIRHDYSDRVDMTSRWKNVNSSKVFLVQNELDVHHYDVHFKPFWKALGGSLEQEFSCSNEHRAWIYRQEGGHVPETIEMAQKIISMLGL